MSTTTSTKFLKSLSTDFTKLLFNAEDYNVIIKVGDSNFKAHSCILRARSPYFHSALSRDWAMKEGNNIIFEKPNISPKIFEMILSYLYSGTISLEQEHPTTILDLLTASDELILLELFTHVKEYFFEKHNKWIRQHPLQILYHTIFRIENCLELQDLCLEIICENPELVFGTTAFTAIEESVLISILKRDDLQMDEIDLWDYLIQWGIAHTFNIKSSSNFNPSLLSQNDLLELSETLKNCVPYIRFNHINIKDLPSRLKPFEILLLNHKKISSITYNNNSLINNINNEITSFPLDSKIIKLKHVAHIARWIDHQEDKNNIRDYRRLPIYDFKILLRGSRDDFSASTFHKLCDNKNATVIIIKVFGTREIIGGYNPISWKGGFFGSWMKSQDSFIFSLGDGENNLRESSKLCRIKPENVNMAVFCANMRGPCFGYRDLWMPNFNNLAINCDSDCNYYNGKIIEPKNFDIEDYEVFQIIKRE
ncbi:hypothetical protein GLOIN_2v1778704 [Rhizophagus irregularis DAOM 181602=DAOM 197198]|uniref:Serine-enriched protein n=2 Tax=Rhizophagus irregularis TaxID=588596 RepID=A0A015KD30_RHIIW|nr:hypothetical protein GLOIN_2v1778704 [Rhizophagus irregularis DAOM 181602=DAOM 197198]EXX57431.1 hypothetical protein RirG_207390 [Rhizophagus irregularis DAOM 197198w]POG68007.1 hypothetical protein GLOIN_2v1778704 [Rhizophagus irregularis DAOM 181602=DAOM 197198]GBC14185.1 hypothetical protein GLOIN_2v1778704 [Rhizophagus irregularis DAOM 181602=DAOM 197198]|eukprot:XP_025174873.1 hypothetical protein GLOIN_2v1778704 [Rhizophagus irregularis DAOM 181602=DAOM 197198]